MKNTLLVALDGSKKSAKTATYVGRACAAGRPPLMQVILFHVLPEVPSFERVLDAGIKRGDLVERFETETREAGKKMLGEMKERIVREGVPQECVVTELSRQRGNVVPQILAAVAEHGCDTIVVGRRGGSMMGQFFTGSVAERLLRDPIGCTVWIVE